MMNFCFFQRFVLVQNCFWVQFCQESEQQLHVNYILHYIFGKHTLKSSSVTTCSYKQLLFLRHIADMFGSSLFLSSCWSFFCIKLIFFVLY